MGVPAVTGQDGLWSMRQARELLLVPERTARDVCDRGLLPRTNLPTADLLSLRVLTAAAAHPVDSDADTRRLRDRNLVDLSRQCYLEGAVSRVLVITSTQASYADDDETLLLLVRRWEEHSPVVLPVGKWSSEIRRHARPGALS